MSPPGKVPGEFWSGQQGGDSRHVNVEPDIPLIYKRFWLLASTNLKSTATTPTPTGTPTAGNGMGATNSIKVPIRIQSSPRTDQKWISGLA